MQEYIAIITILLLIALVILRTITLKKEGIDSIEFGKKDPKDFFIPPFALLYLYLISANAFNLPTFMRPIFYNEALSWIGAGLCILSLSFFIWTMISFKKSFRVGLVENTSQGLITTGAFAISRNPVYVSFAIMLIAQFLVFSSWIFLAYIFLGAFAFHRQILKEETFLKKQYGKEFEEYSHKVNRYL